MLLRYELLAKALQKDTPWCEIWGRFPAEVNLTQTPGKTCRETNRNRQSHGPRRPPNTAESRPPVTCRFELKRTPVANQRHEIPLNIAATKNGRRIPWNARFWWGLGRFTLKVVDTGVNRAKSNIEKARAAQGPVGWHDGEINWRHARNRQLNSNWGPQQQKTAAQRQTQWRQKQRIQEKPTQIPRR